MYSRVGGFLTFLHFLTKGKQRCVVTLVKTWKIAKKKFIGSIYLYHRGQDFLGHALYTGQKIFFTMWVGYQKA
jgi:hypothetical protein